MHKPRSRFASIALAAVLIASACSSGSGDDSDSSASTPAAAQQGSEAAANDDQDEAEGDAGTVEADGAGIDRSELSAAENVALDNIILAVAERPDVWPGFSLADLPTIVPLLGADGQMTSAFTFFHSNPGAAGDAVPVVGVDGLPDLHYIPQIRNVPQPPKFSFEIDADVGGLPTYVFPADTELPFWDRVFVHEAFHVFQIRFWTNTIFEDQEFYTLESRNYELAMLEDRALIAAYQASDDEMTEAIRHFLALRSTRLDEFPGVTLDLQQESLEGAAEWFEWRHTGRFEVDDPWANPTSGNLGDQQSFAQFFAPDFAGIAPLQRFYHSGATQLELLTRLNVDWQPRLEERAAPSDLLADVVIVDPVDRASLVEEARLTYDPDGELPAIAEIWLSATPRAGGEIVVEEQRTFADAPAPVLTCLAEYGITGEDIDANPVLLTPEIEEACVASYEARFFACLTEGGFDLTDLDFDDLPPEAAACLE